jgi:hypothetical protein
MITLRHSLAAFATGALLFSIAAVPASAHSTSDIDRAQAYQLRQIEVFRATGRLTRREHEALVSEQARIADLKRRVVADGVVTAREHRALRGEQYAAERHITELAANGRVNLWRRLKARRFER